jgi:diguanylate cyclase (GGDEF)-like protein/PAS domain S-box-containing protein
MSRQRQTEANPGRDDKQLASSTARKALENKLAAHELTGRKLASATAALLRQMAARDRQDEGRRVVEQDLHDVQARFESAFTSAPIGMALVDMQGAWLQVNDALCRILGRTRDELKETTLQAITHPEDIERDQASLHDLLAGAVPGYQVEKRYRHAWGHYLWVLLTVSLVRDQNGEPLYLVSQIQDISERKELATRMEYLIDHDFLTGLFNRRRFQEELTREVERKSRYGAKGGAHDRSRQLQGVNDDFGQGGDDLLKGVAGALRHRMRQTDVLARVGGDEFAVLLPETDADQAQIVAEGLVKALGRQVAVLGERTICITASIGVAVFADLRAVELLEFADLAMYEAKESGRNQVAMTDPTPSGRRRLDGASWS